MKKIIKSKFQYIMLFKKMKGFGYLDLIPIMQLIMVGKNSKI